MTYQLYYLAKKGHVCLPSSFYIDSIDKSLTSLSLWKLLTCSHISSYKNCITCTKLMPNLVKQPIFSYFTYLFFKIPYIILHIYTIFHCNINFLDFFNWFFLFLFSHATTTIHSLPSFSGYVKKELKTKYKISSISVNLHGYRNNYVFLPNFAWPKVGELVGLNMVIFLLCHYLTSSTTKQSKLIFLSF